MIYRYSFLAQAMNDIDFVSSDRDMWQSYFRAKMMNGDAYK